MIAGFFKPLAAVEHRLVFGHLRDDVSAVLTIGFRHALERQIVGFGRTACENNLLRMGVDEPGRLPSRVFNRFLGPPSKFMIPAGRISEFLAEIGQHRLEHARIDRRGRVIVEIDGQFDAHRKP